MMDASRLVRAIHASPVRIALVATGCGAGILSQLMAVPGCSRTLLDGVIPYHPEALRNYLSPLPLPPSAASRITAELLAVRAFQRASAIVDAEPLSLSSPTPVVFGVSCSGSIATATPHRGQHRVHIAVCGPQTSSPLTQPSTSTPASGPSSSAAHPPSTLRSTSIVFDKSVPRGREGEDSIVVRVLLRAIAEAAGIVAPVPGEVGGPALAHTTTTATAAGATTTASAHSPTHPVPISSILPPSLCVELLVHDKEAVAAAAAASTTPLPPPPLLPLSTIHPRRSHPFLLTPTDRVSKHFTPYTLAFHPPTFTLPTPPDRLVVLSGSFAPLHDGHVDALRAATATLAAYTLPRGAAAPPPAPAAAAPVGGGATSAAAASSADGAVVGSGSGSVGMLPVPAAACSAPGRLIPCFEMTISNADKGVLPAEEIRRRASQFAGGWGGAVRCEGGGGGEAGASVICERAVNAPLIITACSLFYQRARLLPGAAFVVGYDTAVRILDPKYYDGFMRWRGANSGVDDVVGEVGGGDASVEDAVGSGDGEEGVRQMLEEIRAAGCTIVVMGRVGSKGTADEGRFLTLSDLKIPAGFEGMFVGVPESVFRSVT